MAAGGGEGRLAKDLDDIEYYLKLPTPPSSPPSSPPSLTSSSVVDDFVLVHNDEAKPPAVILLGWAGCQDKHLAKYGNIYSDKGCVTLRCTAPLGSLFLRRRRMRELGRRLLDELLDLNLNEHPIFFHVFSNGGAYLYKHVVLAMQERTAPAAPLRVRRPAAPGGAGRGLGLGARRAPLPLHVPGVEGHPGVAVAGAGPAAPLAEAGRPPRLGAGPPHDRPLGPGGVGARARLAHAAAAGPAGGAAQRPQRLHRRPPLPLLPRGRAHPRRGRGAVRAPPPWHGGAGDGRALRRLGTRPALHRAQGGVHRGHLRLHEGRAERAAALAHLARPPPPPPPTPLPG
ncbi:hypothetical protein ONE63_010299 [Megalurothrips usitatus]|uniref:Transmembrane protein 53 n=1 Tax=Megalurothrips usitatus TaxID=439358 RepID=A0AAV7XLL6_9NEOP|nr:hypothetical protein ONE63_010299 [Megalurothrips usitatus]